MLRIKICFDFLHVEVAIRKKLRVRLELLLLKNSLLKCLAMEIPGGPLSSRPIRS